MFCATLGKALRTVLPESSNARRVMSTAPQIKIEAVQDGGVEVPAGSPDVVKLYPDGANRCLCRHLVSLRGFRDVPL